MKIKLTGLMITIGEDNSTISAQYQRDLDGVLSSRLAKLTLNDEASFALSVLQQSVVEAIASVESKVDQA